MVFRHAFDAPRGNAREATRRTAARAEILSAQTPKQCAMRRRSAQRKKAEAQLRKNAARKAKYALITCAFADACRKKPMRAAAPWRQQSDGNMKRHRCFSTPEPRVRIAQRAWQTSSAATSVHRLLPWRVFVSACRLPLFLMVLERERHTSSLVRLHRHTAMPGWQTMPFNPSHDRNLRQTRRAVAPSMR